MNELSDSHTDDFEIRWRNFRSLVDTRWLRIKPLTILLGPNNSGKSSIIAPLLALVQTYDSRDIRIPLVTTGEYVDCGGYSDFIRHHDTRLPLQLGVRYHVHNPIKEMQPVRSYMPAGLEMTFRPGNHKGSIVLNRIQATDLCKRRYYARAKTKTRYNLTGAIRLSEMLPRERNAVLKSLPTNFLFTSTSALSEYDDLESEKPKERTDFSAEFSEYLSAVSGTTSGMFGFLRSVTYVGPLRAKPCRHYDLRAEEVESVGVRGEHVASLLKKTTGPKKRLLNQWVQRFGFGNRVRLVELTESLASIEFVQNDGESLNIADLGFGASQLFPLIVQAVSARQYTLTIAEQPEVHLHPRLQALLGNLFVQLANQGQRVLLETHSEHMLLRIRTLVAKGEIDANNVAIYFVSCEDGISEVQRVHIGEDGHIKPRDWPKGFFDDALRESIDLAKAQIKRREVS